MGQAIRESGLPREDIFVTTKVWNSDLRAVRVMRAFDESIERLGTDYVDLYLIHWPVKGHYREAWQVLEEIYKNGRVKAIGVSNFQIHHLEDILENGSIVPAVNQIEYHPLLVQPELVDFCQKNNIVVEAWSPLMQGQIVSVPVVQKLAEKYAKTPAQIALRWNLQHNVITIPNQQKPHRIAENADIFDFELSEADMKMLDALDEGKTN